MSFNGCETCTTRFPNCEDGCDKMNNYFEATRPSAGVLLYDENSGAKIQEKFEKCQTCPDICERTVMKCVDPDSANGFEDVTTFFCIAEKCKRNVR